MNTPNSYATLTKATCKAAERLGLDQAAFARTIGVSIDDIEKMHDGSFVIACRTSVEQRCLLLIRTLRALHALVGEDQDQHRHWLRSENKGCGGVPMKLMETPTGLADVVKYLEGALQEI